LSFLDLEGRRFLVTGASSGIGKSVALALAAEGAQVAISGRDKQRLEQLLPQLKGSNHCAVPFDLASQFPISGIFEMAVSQLGPLDGLVHCAGAHLVSSLQSLDYEKSVEIFDLNFHSSWRLAQEFRKPIFRAESASIVFLSSVVAKAGLAGVSIYSASKAALDALTLSLSTELSNDQVRVNAVAAGVVDTPLTNRMRQVVGERAWEEIIDSHPGGIGVPEDVARAVLFLVSPKSSWIRGTIMAVDGGFAVKRQGR
jgi:NAD(P)-dependent dehydrogenase (short-subunit alcohol dehydrogenase family)